MTILRFAVGDVRITLVREVLQTISFEGLFAGADDSTITGSRSWLHPHFVDDDGRPLLSIHALVVESAGQRILVDTCVGDRAIPGMEALTPAVPVFLDDLARAGFPPDSIDTVVCTHMHFDHVGWNTRWDGEQWVPTFPSARYLFGRLEYEHWATGAEGMASTFADAVVPVVASGCADLVETDHRITSEVRLVPTPGHTPGHVSVLIESAGEEAVITGDLVHHPIQIAAPSWTMVADSDAAQASSTRQAFIADAVASGRLVFGTHFAGPSCGHVRTGTQGWWFDAAPDRAVAVV